MNELSRQPWLEIHDPQLTSEALIERVEAQLEERRAQLGPVARHFPTFQAQASALDEATANMAGASAALRDALRQLQELPPPATHPVLAPSPATSLPLLGRLWTLIRSQTHHLVLFYVNRNLAHQTQTTHLLSTALHELSVLLLAQQEQIEQLRARLEENDETEVRDGG